MGKDIVKYRYIILIFFVIILAVSCAFLPEMVKKVNYDLTSYLPEGYDTYDGYQFLSKHFNIHGDVEIGIEATYTDAKTAVTKITSLDGVTSTTWADLLTYLTDMGIYEATDAEYVALREILTDAPAVDDGQKHNWAILVTLKYPPSSNEAIELFQTIKSELKDIIGEGNYAMSGMTEQANALFETVFDELGLYAIIAGIVVLLILAFTTNSLMEPIILLLTLGVSILINLGTNVLFPSTSIITFACTAILQLGLSMDYAIFLLHQYRAELKSTLDHKEALANAIPKSAKAVAASALTTVGGFLALLCMKFGIGADLGLSLAKGILCSLLTVIFLQPCLMLMMDKARVKTQHRCLNLQFKTPVKKSIKHRGVITVILALLLVPMFFISNSLSFTYIKFLPDNPDRSDKTELAEKLGKQVMIITPYRVFTSDGVPSGAPEFERCFEFADALKEMQEDKDISFSLGLFSMIPKDAAIDGQIIIDTIDGLEDFPNKDLAKKMIAGLQDENGTIPILRLLNAMFTFEAFIPPDAMNDLGFGDLTTFLSPSGYTMFTVGINPKYETESAESFAILDKINAKAAEIFGANAKIYTTGITQAAYDFALITPTDFTWVTVVSILAILIILILTLGGIKFPLLLVALIEFGIWLNLALQYVFAGGGVNFMSYLIITAVQLGATVDYAILVSTKYRDLRKRYEPRQAAYLATTKSSMAIVTSALIMSGACFSVFAISSNLVIREMTFLMARGALLSAILVILCLPAILSIADRPKGSEIHIPRTNKLRKYKRASKLTREGWKDGYSYGATKVKPQKFSGEEIYELLHDGYDIQNASDSAMKNRLDKLNRG